jgi:hypothetical protein
MKKAKVLPWRFGRAPFAVLVFAGAFAAGLGACAVEASVEPSVAVDVGTQWIHLIPGVPVDNSNGIRTTELTLVFSKSIAVFTDDLNFNAGRGALAALFTFTPANGEAGGEEGTPTKLQATALLKNAEGVYILSVSNVPKDDRGGEVLVTINAPGITPPSQVWRLDEQPVAPALGHIASLTEFRFKALDNAAFLSADVVGRIDQQLKTVAVTVPAETPLGDLTPALTLNPGSSAEGGTDFTAPSVIFTVTAEDGITEAVYFVTVTAEDEPSTAPDSGTVQVITDSGELYLIIGAPECGKVPFPSLMGHEQITSMPFETAQYTGVVIWSIDANSINGKERGVFDTNYGQYDNFWSGAVYTATVVLAAKPGYTFTGVTANAFAYSSYGHTAPADNEDGQITNPVGSGSTLTVTIVFPVTEEDMAEIGGPI